MIGTPNGLIDFNEYHYLAKNKIDMDYFNSILSLNNLSTDLSLYPVDINGYPKPIDSDEFYFQGNGLWYRETGGLQPTIDKNSGNNPHVGPYDRGSKYLSQFTNIIPNYSGLTLTSETITEVVDELFYNYNFGSINNYSGETYVNSSTLNGFDLDGCLVIEPMLIDNPVHDSKNECGCDNTSINKSLSICISKDANNNQETPCVNMAGTTPFDENGNEVQGVLIFQYYQYNSDGTPYYENGSLVLRTSKYTSQECCLLNNGTPFMYDTFGTAVLSETIINSGYICCDSSQLCGSYVGCSWKVNPTDDDININGDLYLKFSRQDSSFKVVTPDGSNCIPNLTIPIPGIVDPFDGQVGYGCKITQAGFTDLSDTSTSIIINTYLRRPSKIIGCTDIYQG
jgi:hypothetical protein